MLIIISNSIVKLFIMTDFKRAKSKKAHRANEKTAFNMDKLTLESIDNNFFLEGVGRNKSIEDYLRLYDSQVNRKIADGLKKVVRLLLVRMDEMVEAKSRVVVRDEVAEHVRSKH